MNSNLWKALILVFALVGSCAANHDPDREERQLPLGLGDVMKLLGGLQNTAGGLAQPVLGSLGLGRRRKRDLLGGLLGPTGLFGSLLGKRKRSGGYEDQELSSNDFQ